MKTSMKTLAAVFCCTMTSIVAFAQNNLDEILQQVKERVQLADKQLNDGKLQLKAAEALVWNELGDKRDFDRALIYANRALQIAESQIVLKDTLKGNTYLVMGDIYLGKQDRLRAFECCEKGLEAIEQELGRFDPWTIFKKLYTGYAIMMTLDIPRGSLYIQQGFLDGQRAPEDKRIKNIDELAALYDLAVEYMTADLAAKMQRCLPLIVYENKRYLVLETSTWNMEKPIVGWLMPSVLELLINKKIDPAEKGEMILCDYDDTQAPLRTVSYTSENLPEFNITFGINTSDYRQILFPENNSRILFFSENIFSLILEKYHAFKVNAGK